MATTSRNPQQFLNPRTRNQILQISPILLFSALGLLIFLLTARGVVDNFLLGTRQNEFLLIFVLTMYFPLTYMAYYLVHSHRRITRLREDMHWLGYGKLDSETLADKVNELYDRAHSPLSYLLFITLTVLLCILGLSLFLWKPDSADLSGLSLSVNVNTLQAMRYGFLGAYIFSAYLLYRRYSTNDLQPTVYLYCAFTLTAGIAFNYVAFEALANIAKATNEPADGIGAGLIAILAFSIGYFPYLAVRWFNKLAHSTFQVGERRADSLPLGIIDGISDWHETRLRDCGIDDVQNLASAEIVDLLVNTAFGAQQIISWIDQAILYQYLDQNEIESFRRGKINMFSDFWEQVEPSDGRLITDMEIQELAKSLQTTTEKLKNLKKSTENGPNTHRVKDYWRRVTKESIQEKDSPLHPTVYSSSEIKTITQEKEAITRTGSPWEKYPSIDTQRETIDATISSSDELPFDYYFLNHTSFLRNEKQAEFQARTHVARNHYDIRVIVDSYYPGALERIDQVEYILHKSYPNPRRFCNTPENKFLLKELANGQFVLMAQVFMKDRTEPVRLQRYITLWESGPVLP